MAGKKYYKKKKKGVYLNLVERAVNERMFIAIILLGVILSLIMANFGGKSAMWLGFFFAAYAAVGNDSIQSLGTFIESNKDKKWWILWLFTGVIFLLTVTFSWWMYDGDVTYQRLSKVIGETAEGLPIYQYQEVDEFSFFQLIAPLVLLVLTRLRMPVSTTFLLLSVFSADSSGILSMVSKSLSGYGIAFVLSFVVWYSGYEFIRKYFKSRTFGYGWSIVQWTVSGSLWAVWLMQDGANIAVFLPRKLEVYQFLIFSFVIFCGLGLLFYLRGDRIQQVVSEKIRIADVRAATLVDFTYVILLIYKLFISTVPLSTTWVFLGVMGGREIAINLARRKAGTDHKVKALQLIGKDFAFAFVGLLVSVVMAAGANKGIRDEIIAFLTGGF